jgi:hypothetical protein
LPCWREKPPEQWNHAKDKGADSNGEDWPKRFRERPKNGRDNTSQQMKNTDRAPILARK